jgi:hypothetical protein
LPEQALLLFLAACYSCDKAIVQTLFLLLTLNLYSGDVELKAVL